MFAEGLRTVFLTLAVNSRGGVPMNRDLPCDEGQIEAQQDTFPDKTIRAPTPPKGNANSANQELLRSPKTQGHTLE